MSGSSRSLLRNIASVFENWQKNKNWNEAPSQDIKDLNDTIYAYKERHNLLASINSQLNSELRSTYSKYINESLDISKEVLFLDLLTRLLPVLSSEEVKVWLATYLRPAIESTGFDVSFVNKAREFIRLVLAETFPTDDPQLEDRRASIAQMVLGYVMRIYLGTDQEAYGLLGLEYKDASSKDQDTHENIEKVRFMERNCTTVLLEFGQHYPESFFRLLDTHFITVDNRLKALSLISMFVTSKTFHAKAIIRTPLFNNLLICLLRDESETIIASALSLTVLLMGKLCDQLSPYLPDLLVIYTRLLLWLSPDKRAIFTELTARNGPDKWAAAEPDLETLAMNSDLYRNEEFNLLYFTTLLYAFFPQNLIKFARNPSQFLEENPPTVLHHTSSSGQADIESIITSRTTDFCEQMRVHPNMMQQIPTKDELNSPLKWILDRNEGVDLTSDDIMLQSLRLNPTYMLWLPNMFVLPKYFHEKLHELGFLPSPTTSNFQTQPTRELRSASHWSGFGSNNASKRGSIDVAHEDMSTPRRSSLVPSTLLGEKSPNEPHIKFKNVDYGLSKSGPRSASPKPSNHESIPTSESESGISDLFSAHEKLYKMSNTRRNSVQQELQNPQLATGNFQATSKSASVLLNEQLKGKNNEEVSFSKGGALEFYQRELLLCKNELEFTIYMKYLNKLNYIKSKAQMAEISRQLAHVLKDVPENVQQPEKHQSLILSLEELQAKSRAALTDSKAEAARLSERVTELQKKFDVVTNQLSDSQHENKALRDELEAYKSSLKDLEVELNHLKLEQATSSVKPVAEPPEREITRTPETPNPLIPRSEEELQSVRTDLEIARSNYSALQRELKDLEEKMDLTVRGYEKQVTGLKLDLGGTVRDQVRHYERKIQELNATIMRYATSIEEKNNMIVQLSTSKPIKIPGGRDMKEARASPVKPRNIPVPTRQNRNLEFGTPDQRPGRNMQDFFETRSSSGSLIRSSTSNQLVQPNTRPQAVLRLPTTQSIPIIKGRGGYQKRSKRM